MLFFSGGNVDTAYGKDSYNLFMVFVIIGDLLSDNSSCLNIKYDNGYPIAEKEVLNKCSNEIHFILIIW